MVKQQSRSASDADRHGEDWPQLISFSMLLAAVIGVLLLGAVLRTEVPDADAGGGEAPGPSSAVLAAGAGELRHRGPDRLAQRAAADLHRLGRASGEWTAQLGLFVRIEAVGPRKGERQRPSSACSDQASSPNCSSQ